MQYYNDIFQCGGYVTVSEFIEKYKSSYSFILLKYGSDFSGKPVTDEILNMSVEPNIKDSVELSDLSLWLVPKFTVQGLKLNPATQRYACALNPTGIAIHCLSIETKKNIYQAFNAMLNFAVKLDYLPKNPLSSLGTFKDANNFDKPAEKIQYYTAEQFVEFISIAKENAQNINTVQEWAYYVFFAIAFYTGARKGEIHALKWSDIDGNIIHIRSSITQKLKGEDVETPPKKPSSVRDIQMPKPLLDILEEHKARQQAAARDMFSNDFRICNCEHLLRDTTIEKKTQPLQKPQDFPISVYTISDIHTFCYWRTKE